MRYDSKSHAGTVVFTRIWWLFKLISKLPTKTKILHRKTDIPTHSITPWGVGEGGQDRTGKHAKSAYIQQTFINLMEDTQ